MESKELIIFYPSFANGGITRNLENILKFLSKKKIKIFLFSHNVKNNIKYKNLKIIDKSFKTFKKKNNFNLIISSAINLFSFLRINKNIKVIFSMQNHLPAILLAIIFKKKIIIRNSEEIFGATQYADHKISAYFVLILKLFLYSFSDSIIAISKKSKKSLEQLGINKLKIRLIYNPFITKIIKNINKNYSYGKSFNIISVGRLTKQKNFSSLIDIISILQKKYPFINLKIIGNGPDYNILNSKVKKNKKINIIQWKKNLHKHYKKSHLFILNSYYEGLPNILIEAINNNVPSIATNCSGTMDILMNGKGGFIVPVGDKNAMINKIEYVIQNYKKSVFKTKISKKNIFRFNQQNCNKYYIHIKKYI